MRLPIDTRGMQLICVKDPEPVVDFETRAPRADANGEPLWTVDLLVMAPGTGGEVITVKLAGRPEGLTQGTPLEIEGLVAQPWSMGDRSGVSFRATRLKPAGQSAAKAA
jgi:hypothetical protein